MKATKYLTMYIAAFILVTLVSATGGTLLTNMVALNGTFASTGLGTLFSATILGIIFAAAIFYALYKIFGGKGI